MISNIVFVQIHRAVSEYASEMQINPPALTRLIYLKGFPVPAYAPVQTASRNMAVINGLHGGYVYAAFELALFSGIIAFHHKIVGQVYASLHPASSKSIAEAPK